jgi:hypothetical protein
MARWPTVLANARPIAETEGGKEAQASERAGGQLAKSGWAPAPLTYARTASGSQMQAIHHGVRQCNMQTLICEHRPSHTRPICSAFAEDSMCLHRWCPARR